MSFTYEELVNEPIKPKVPDAYEDLNVSVTASRDQIKASFNRLALMHHPDKKAPGEAVDAADFRRIREAWEILRDDETKAKYDKDYSRVCFEWSEYRWELSEFQKDPHAWRRKQEEKASSQKRKRATNATANHEEDERPWQRQRQWHRRHPRYFHFRYNEYPFGSGNFVWTCHIIPRSHYTPSGHAAYSPTGDWYAWYRRVRTQR